MRSIADDAETLFSTRRMLSGTKFGPSKPNRLGVNRGSPKFRDPGPGPLEMERD